MRKGAATNVSDKGDKSITKKTKGENGNSRPLKSSIKGKQGRDARANIRHTKRLKRYKRELSGFKSSSLSKKETL